jgi:hypothetical protein
MAPFVWIAIALPGDPVKFPHGPSATLFVTFIGAVVAFFVSCAAWQVDSAVRVIFPDEATIRIFRDANNAANADERSKRLIGDFIGLRGELMQSVALLGFMVSLFTLSVGAFRYCNKNYDTAWYQKFHPEYVLLLGVYYSGLLVLVLVPPYLRLMQSGRSLREVLNRPSGGAAQTVPDFLELRKKLDESLALNVGLADTFRNSILVLSPLISGVVPLLIGLGPADSAAGAKDAGASTKAASPESPAKGATPTPAKADAPAPKGGDQPAPEKPAEKAKAPTDKGAA